MLLTSLIGKPITVDKTPRGFCVGLGIAKKTGKLKYLLCSEEENGQTTFAVPYNLLIAVRHDVLQLSKLRAVLPKQYAPIYSALPVYDVKGKHLGELENAEWTNETVDCLFVNGKRLPFYCVSALSDAVLVNPISRFPLGQPIPFPYLEEKRLSQNVVTKSVLKQAVQSQSLIRLTLSLAPFSVL